MIRRAPMMIVVITVIAVPSLACLTIGRPAAHTRSATGRGTGGPCLGGVWTAGRLSQLGPAWVMVAFGRTARTAFASGCSGREFAESGTHHVDQGAVVFSRASNATTIWLYRIEGDRRALAEAVSETHTYRRSNLAPSSGASGMQVNVVFRPSGAMMVPCVV
jgi:hypothetical protein